MAEAATANLTMNTDWAFGGTLGVLGPFLFILLAGWLATDIWRWIGVIFAGDLDENSEIIRWVQCVATALIAGVIAQLIVFPTGALSAAPLPLRLAAIVVGIASFLLTRKNVLVGILAAQSTLLGGWWLIAHSGI